MEGISALFTKYGNHDYIGEKISQSSHLIQTAMLAEETGASNELVIAAFLHDIGQFIGLERKLTTIDNLGIENHEIIGADFLSELGFEDYITSLVREHVNAKRYLVTVNSHYYQKLSDASKQTLALQGGPMNDEEVLTFQKMDYCRDLLRLRSWDEQAKRLDLQLKPLEYYINLCRETL